jgi:hypothetical protein
MKTGSLTILIILILMVTYNCQHREKPRQYNLGNGIVIKAQPAYPDEDISTLVFLEIIQDKKSVFKDSTRTEYSLNDPLYPLLLNFKTHLELLVEIDSRPNKNLIYKFMIQNQKLVRIDTLPTFLTFAKNLDSDNNLEYVGYWDYGQVWGDSIEITGYNPLIYYEITDNGIQLDSFTTKIVNKEIFGEFYGFFYNEQVEFPYQKESKLSIVLEQILK